jgi:serine/threonine protein kinase
LGSLNGTYVNGRKYGGRPKHETPEQGAKRHYPELHLKDGDEINVGQTVLTVHVEEAKRSGYCGDSDIFFAQDIAPDELKKKLFGAAGKGGKAARLNIPGYTVEKEVARGGYGAVYRARRDIDGGPVAIKVMASRVAADDNAIAKFKRELEIARQLQHPHIVRVFECGNAGGTFYIVMEFCEEGTMADLMRKSGGRIPVEKAIPLILQAVSGLAHAHDKGFVHRDIKPGNILISRGTALVSDFGMTKSFEQAGLSGLSVTGSYAGTPVFSPREQITSFKYVKPTADIWSMGATIYCMLTGELPLPFDKKRDPIDVILNEAAIPILKRAAKLPKKLAQVIDQALAAKPKDRFLTGEMHHALKKAVA